MVDQNNDKNTKMELRVARAYDAAEGIRSFELVHPAGEALPPFTPGAHIAVHTPSGTVRKYSLCNAPAETNRYVITVKREDKGQGGSLSMHTDVAADDLLPISVPDNAFPLTPNAKAYLFIAGGIGITPMMSMIRSFGELSPVPWKLYYLTRTPEMTPFAAELGGMTPSQVKIHYDRGDPAKSFDLWPVLEKPNTAHLYCCGPRGLMDAVRDMTGHWTPGNIHFENFLEGGGVRPSDKPFTVALARSGQSFEVPVGKSILETLREHRLSAASSCESGTCGTCRTNLLEGEADHRDMVLTPEEMSSNIMICVSRAKSEKLVLDL
jgi:phthalate 4,5-dioxygenase reductase subunit